MRVLVRLVLVLLLVLAGKAIDDISPHVRESGFRNPGVFCLWNPESWALESGIQHKESGILLKIGIQNPTY